MLEVARTQAWRPSYNEFHYNLALGYLAAAAESNGHETLIIQQRDEPDEELIARLLAFRPDVAGFTCNTYAYPGTLAFKNKLLRHLECPCLIGGVHATCALDESTRDFDIVICGEGEETLVELLSTMRPGAPPNVRNRVRGIAFRNEAGKIVVTPRRPRLDDLDRYGPPKRIEPFQHLDKQVYPAVPGHPPFAPISFSRGCVMRCSFCTNETMYQSRLVTRRPDLVVDEMQELNAKYGITDFYVHDEDVLSDVGLVRDVCNRLIALGSPFTWMGMSRIEPITRGIAALMRKAGCVMLAFGLESGSSALRKEFGKPFGAEVACDKIEAVFDVGIIPVGLFVLGTPDETYESLRMTFDFASSLKCIRFRFAYVYPFPGTRLREKVDAEGLWLDEKFKRHEYAGDHSVPVIRCKVTPDILVATQHDFLTRIYSSTDYAKKVNMFVRSNPAWREPILEEWRNVAQEEIGIVLNWDCGT